MSYIILYLDETMPTQLHRLELGQIAPQPVYIAVDHMARTITMEYDAEAGLCGTPSDVCHGCQHRYYIWGIIPTAAAANDMMRRIDVMDPTAESIKKIISDFCATCTLSDQVKSIAAMDFFGDLYRTFIASIAHGNRTIDDVSSDIYDIARYSAQHDTLVITHIDDMITYLSRYDALSSETLN